MYSLRSRATRSYEFIDPTKKVTRLKLNNLSDISLQTTESGAPSGQIEY